MLAAVTSDSNYQAISAICGVFTTLILSVTAVITLRLKLSMKKTERKVNDLGVVAKSTHTMVNGGMAVQLQLVEMLTRERAKATKNPRDIFAADLASKAYATHMEAKAEVERQPGTDAQKSGS